MPSRPGAAQRAQSERIVPDLQATTQQAHTTEAESPPPDPRTVLQLPGTTKSIVPDSTLATQRVGPAETEETELPVRRTGDEVNEDEIEFRKKYGDLIPSATTDVPYVSNTFMTSGKSKADHGLTSFSFGFEWRLLRARVGTHRKLRIVLPKSGADVTPSRARTLKVRKASDRCSKIPYFQGH